MTREELKGWADVAFDFAMNRLKANVELVPIAHVVGADGSVSVVTALPGDGPVEREKNAFADFINGKIAETNGQAVILVADTVQTEVTSPEAVQRLDRGERFTADECIRRGWGKREEAIVTTIETPSWFWVSTQRYRRNAHGDIILGARKEDSSDNPTAGMEGRFMSFFRHRKATA